MCVELTSGVTPAAVKCTTARINTKLYGREKIFAIEIKFNLYALTRTREEECASTNKAPLNRVQVQYPF